MSFGFLFVTQAMSSVSAPGRTTWFTVDDARKTVGNRSATRHASAGTDDDRSVCKTATSKSAG